MTKTFVAATIMQLVAEGRIDLDAPIETYLPGRIRGEGIDANVITVRQLMRHQSGLPEYFDADTPPPDDPTTGEQLLDMALTRPAQFAPGARMKYTNTNYIVLGLLIEKVTGRPVADEITWRIIVPLGLFDTYFPAPGDNGAASGLRGRLRVGRRPSHRRHRLQRVRRQYSGRADLDERGHLGVHHRAPRRPDRAAAAVGPDDGDRSDARRRRPALLRARVG